MPIVAVFQGPTVTRASYEQSVRKLTGGKRSRMESPGDWPVPGMLVHVAGESENGFRVVDVWESMEAFQRFGEKLQPILQEVGITDAPETYEVHALVKG